MLMTDSIVLPPSDILFRYDCYPRKRADGLQGFCLDLNPQVLAIASRPVLRLSREIVAVSYANAMPSNFRRGPV